MSPVWWMCAASVACWATTAAMTGREHAADALLGVLAPFASAVATWTVARQTPPEGMMAALVKALALKMVFFGVYVAVMLRVVGVRPTPFVAGLTVCFIVLFVMQARFLRRLFEDGARQARA